MLINARRAEELRVAILDGTRLDNYQVEVSEKGLQRGNIYRGIIANIQPALNAAFIDYGADRHGFLAIQDVVPDAYYSDPAKKTRPRIDEVLEKGKPVVVQVQKEPEGQKGAALTTNLSLAGRYLVLTPFDPTRGVSRKVEDEETRRKLRAQVNALEVPTGCGVIMRTNALEQNKTALHRDLLALLRLWRAVETEARRGRGIRLLYSDQDLLVKALRDHLDTSVEEVLVDGEGAYEKAELYMRAFMPRSKTGLVRYDERLPLFARYEVEEQIDRIYERSTPLPSGGSIVIDKTEALTAIDVNSGKATKAGSQEETALLTNLEAAREVARQLRLRDLGGLVVVDFIDMRSSKAERKIEKELRDAMKADKARQTIGRISPNGLLEINRQRIQQALAARTQELCPACAGTGRVMSKDSLGLTLLRKIESRAAAVAIERVKITLNPDFAETFRGGRKREIQALERDFALKIEINGARRLRVTEHEFEWFDRPAGEEVVTEQRKWGGLAPAAAPEADGPVRRGQQSASRERDKPKMGETAEGKKRGRRRRGGRGRNKKKADGSPEGNSAAVHESTETAAEDSV
ncbi:MAG: Rne/Rng family ribonuclease [Acidobacteriota bacterium]